MPPAPLRRLVREQVSLYISTDQWNESERRQIAHRRELGRWLKKLGEV
jgi:hypothetical protein